MIWNKLKDKLFLLNLHLKKKGLYMRWRKNIWKKNWIDIKRELLILRINVGN